MKHAILVGFLAAVAVAAVTGALVLIVGWFQWIYLAADYDECRHGTCDRPFEGSGFLWKRVVPILAPLVGAFAAVASFAHQHDRKDDY